MPGARSQIVCFDLGGVVVRICHGWREAAERAGLPCHPELTSGESAQERADIMHAHEIGLLDDPSYFRRFAAISGGRYTPEEVERVHDAWLLGEYPGVGELIDGLNRRGVTTACLSNTNPRHWRMLGERDGGLDFPAFRSIQVRHASHLLGAAKPGRAIFDAFEAETGARGPAILFLDDREENVAAARAAGWRAEWIDPGAPPAGVIAERLRRHGF